VDFVVLSWRPAPLTSAATTQPYGGQPFLPTPARTHGQLPLPCSCRTWWRALVADLVGALPLHLQQLWLRSTVGLAGAWPTWRRRITPSSRRQWSFSAGIRMGHIQLPETRSPACSVQQATARLGVTGLSATPPRLSATLELAFLTASISCSPSNFNARLLCFDFDLVSSFRGNSVPLFVYKRFLPY
jgi:hypothetical protein